MISVVIPMYNSEKTIRKAIESVIKQSYKDFEIIVVNDGSTDSSTLILEEIMKENENIKIKLINKNNGGVSSARNEGIRNCNGEFIAFLDSDDEWLPNKLELQMNCLLGDRTIDFIGCNRNSESTKVFLKRYNKFMKIGFMDMMLKMFPQTSTAIVKKEVLESVGLYDEKQKYAEDGYLWLRICSRYNRYMMPESLVITGGGKPHFGYSGLSSRIWEMEKGELKNIREMYKLKNINYFHYIFFWSYSIMKFLRRFFIVEFFRK